MEPANQPRIETPKPVRHVPAEESCRTDRVSALLDRNAELQRQRDCAENSAFMFSVIQSCRLNDRDPLKYIRYLLENLKKSKEGDDLTPLLPCYCGI